MSNNTDFDPWLEHAIRESFIGTAGRDSGARNIFQDRGILVVPPNADVRVVGTSSVNSTQGVATFNGVLARLV